MVLKIKGFKYVDRSSKTIKDAKALLNDMILFLSLHKAFSIGVSFGQRWT